MINIIASIMLLVVVFVLSVLISSEGPTKDRDWFLVRYGSIPKALAITLFLITSCVIYSASMAAEIKLFVISFVWIFYIYSIGMLLVVYRKKIWFNRDSVFCQEFYGKKKYLDAESIKSKEKDNYGFKIIDNNRNKIHCSNYMSGAIELENLVDYLLTDEPQ